MHRTTSAAAAAAALLSAASLVTGCSRAAPKSGATERCIAATADRLDRDAGVPKACEGLSDEDYTVLVLSAVLDEMGAVDRNGRIDLRRPSSVRSGVPS